MKRIFFIEILLCLYLLLTAQTAWDGTISEVTPTGNTYYINNAQQLAWVAQQSQTNNFNGYVVRLTNDIDLGWKEVPSKHWTPIGTADLPFQGEFDGQNHIIRNLYIMGSFSSAGLFAAIGNEAVVHNVGLSQGLINTDGTNDVGSFVGINAGNLHHCFSMVQIIAHNGNRIGCLTGTNKGTIEYCYNTGIITDANSYIGGLVGSNMAGAVVRECYNTGYTKGSNNAGALFGINQEGTTLENVYFDQQMTRMHATGLGETDPTVRNTDHAITTTPEFILRYKEKAEWDVSLNTYYPQLACFAGSDASIISTYGILLNSSDLPIERADGVGAPANGNKIRKEFLLCKVEGTDVTWESENESVIQFDNYYFKGLVFRPCALQEVMLRITTGNDTKTIYTVVKNYDSFDAGILAGNYIACWNEAVKLTSATENPTKEASGGKDDEQTAPTDYQYLLHMYEVTYDEDGNEIRTLLQNLHLTYREYHAFYLPTDTKGHYVFTQEVHDSQCHTEFAETEGELHLHVMEEFDPGKLCSNTDTIYGVPCDTTVLSCKDASGGGGEFEYMWNMTQLRVNYITGEVDTIKKNDRVYQGYTAVTTASCPVHITEAGEYIYQRHVKEATCKQQFSPSDFLHRIVVFENIQPGSIAPDNQNLCTPQVSDTIHEILPAQGGNGRYIYRWLCNGIPIGNSDTTDLPLDEITLEAGNTYTFVRQVTDDTGLAEWQTSDGEVVLSIYESYNAGVIKQEELYLCMNTEETQTINLNISEQQAIEGEGEFEYCWLLTANDKVLDTLYINQNSLNRQLLLKDYPALQLPAIITIERLVRNSYCKSLWQHSAGKAIYYVGVHEYLTEIVSVCEMDMPYTGSYQFEDGTVKAYTLSRDTESIIMHDKTEWGCNKEVTLQCAVRKVPVVEVAEMAAVCQTDTVMYLQYTLKEGAPDHYLLTINEAATKAGFLSVDTMLPKGNVIPIEIPAIPLGNYNLYIQFYNATEGENHCIGHVIEVPFTIALDGYVHNKWSDVLFVDNSDKNCEPDCEDDITFNHYQWYKDGEPVEGANGQYYYEEGGLNGVYYAMLTATDGTTYRSCDYEMRPGTNLQNIPPNNTDNLLIYPVPATAGMPIQIHLPQRGSLTIYSIDGQTLQQFSSDNTICQLPAPLTAGIYLVTYTNATGNRIVRKLIVE